MTTAIAWIGAQLAGAAPAWGWLYVWTIFCDLVVLGAISRVVAPSRGLRRAANDG